MEVTNCGNHEERGSALWGKGSRGGEARASALWGGGKNGRGLVLVVALLVGLMVPNMAFAAKPVVPTDRTPPTTSITSGPANLSVAAGPVAFSFQANEQATFQCSLDGSPYAACTSPFLVPAPTMGFHQFSVKATDLAGNADKKGASTTFIAPYRSTQAYLPGSLLARAQANPMQSFDVIIQVKKGSDSKTVSKLTESTGAQYDSKSGNGPKQETHDFNSINGFQATLPGWLILWVAEKYPVVAIVPNRKVVLADYAPAQEWPVTVRADAYYTHAAKTCPTAPLTGLLLDPLCKALPALTAPEVPTIAVVDSGIDSSLGGLGDRVIGHVDLTGNAVKADDYGHGTFVASMAAGGLNDHPGATPQAKLYDVRAVGADGSAKTSDVIAAADWILKHKDEYNIKVANFSLHSATPGSFKFDPLDKAVEALWFNGVTVVAAAGNYGVANNTPVNMYFAPANDPFVLTVGATDTHGTATPADDQVAPFSAFGHTADGFSKPEVVAPGRYMIGATASDSGMALARPDHVVGDGLMRLSGTSFSAPIVAGAAATLLGLHPSWTPDQVKGALMAGALHLQDPNASPLADGVGEINVVRSAEMTTPPNANLALDRFVAADPTAAGGKSFATQSWTDAANTDMSWVSQSWTDQSWTDQSWTDMSWVSQSWTDQSWTDAAKVDMSWVSQSWTDQSWTDSSVVDMSWTDQSWTDMSWVSQSWTDVSQADAALADMSWVDGSKVD